MLNSSTPFTHLGDQSIASPIGGISKDRSSPRQREQEREEWRQREAQEDERWTAVPSWTNSARPLCLTRDPPERHFDAPFVGHRFWWEAHARRNDGMTLLFHVSATGLPVDFVVPRQVPSEEDSMKQVAAKSA